MTQKFRHKKSFYIKEFVPGKWHVCRLENDLPLYDDAAYGNDKPLVFTDEDLAIEYRNKLNNEVWK